MQSGIFLILRRSDYLKVSRMPFVGIADLQSYYLATFQAV